MSHPTQRCEQTSLSRITIFCDPEKSDNLFMDMMFVISVARKDTTVLDMNLQLDKCRAPFVKKYANFYHVECPEDININDIKKLFDKSIDLNNISFFTYGKFNNIKSIIDNLYKKPAPITINLGNLSCDNLRDALKTNLCDEIKRKLAQVFDHRSTAEKLFITISQDEINKQVSQLIICITESKPLEENMKNAARKLLIDWAPSFTRLMVQNFVHYE